MKQLCKCIGTVAAFFLCASIASAADFTAPFYTTPLTVYNFLATTGTATLTGYFVGPNNQEIGSPLSVSIGASTPEGFVFVAGQSSTSGWGLTNGSATVTNTSTPSSIAAGEQVTGANITPGTVVVSFVANTSVTLSQSVNATASSQSLTFGNGIPLGATGFIGTLTTQSLWYTLSGPSYTPASGCPVIATSTNISFGSAYIGSATHY